MGCIRFRPPVLADASAIWRLVREAGVLDENSCYLYLLLCRDFAETCLVAELDDSIVGFVTGYRPPMRPEVLFVWQVAVAPSARKQRLALRMLLDLVERLRSDGVQNVEATVTPTNEPSRALFRSLARELDAPIEQTEGFQASDFHFAEHEDEDLIRIGPFGRASASCDG